MPDIPNQRLRKRGMKKAAQCLVETTQNASKMIQ